MQSGARHVVTVRHNFETAHRVPPFGGKCRNLHGHSWQAEASIGAPRLDHVGAIVQFGDFKRGFREWVDRYVDHGTMLGAADPFAEILARDGSKVFRFGAVDADGPEALARDLPWPTVEAVAELLARVVTELLANVSHVEGAAVVGLRLQETPVNVAEWRAVTAS